MATQVGKIWRYGASGMPQTVRLLPAQSGNIPVPGDICQYDSSFRPKYKPDSLNADSGELLMIRYICIDGRQELDILGRPGYTTETNTTPGIAYFGGHGSRETSADRAIAGKRSHFIVVDQHLQWVMDRDESGDSPIIGTKCGVIRQSAGIWVFDIDVTSATVEIIAPYEADILDGVASTAVRFWVKACSPGGNV